MIRQNVFRLGSQAILSLIFFLLSTTSALGGDLPWGFPVGPPAPPVDPPPLGTMLKVSGDSILVVQFKTEYVIRAHPAALVDVEQVTGPLRIRGKFADGNGKVETRSYAGPCIAILTPIGKGRVEVDAIPIGLKDAKEIISTAIDVDGNQVPIPPPIPTPPGPNPPDPPSPVVVEGSRYIVIIEETEQAAFTRAQFLTDPTLKARMKERGHLWRVVDQNVVNKQGIPPADVKRFLDDARGKKLPQVYFVDAKGNQIGPGQDCPPTAAGLITLLQKVGG